MALKKTIAVGGTLALLMSSSALVVDAFAQKGAMLQPQSGWSVKNVGERGPGSYCAIARRFDGNVILTLAKNQRSEISLAFDFETMEFNTGRLSRVVLDPGAGQQRSYNMRPNSPRAFVVKLGQDDPFYNALTQTGYMRLEIDNVIYNFNLSDIDGGKNELASCLGPALRSAASSTPSAPPSVNPAVLPPLPDNGGEIEALNGKIASLQAENARLKAQGAQSPAPAPAASPQALEALRLENSNLKEILQATTLQLEKARQQAASTPAPAPAANKGELSALQARLASVEAKNMQLERSAAQSKKQFEEAKEQLKTVKDLAQSSLKDLKTDQAQLIETLKRENEELLQKLASVESQAGGSDSPAYENLGRAMDSLEKENRTLRLRLQEVRAAQEAAESQAAQASQKIGALEGTLAKQSAATETYMAHLQDLQNQIAAIEEERNSARAQQAKSQEAYEAEIAALRNENLDLAAQRAAQAERIPALEKENLKLKEEFAAKVAGVPALEEKIADLQTTVKTLRGEKDELLLELETGRGAAGEAQAALADLMAEKEKLARALEAEQAKVAEVENLKTALAAMKAEGAAILEDMGESSASLQKAEAERVALKKENDLLRNDLKSAQEKLAAAGEEAARLTDELAQEKTRAAKLADAAAGLESADERLKALHAENEELVERLALADKNIEDMDSKYAALMERNTVLTGDLMTALETLEAEREIAAATQEKLAQAGGAEKMLEEARAQLAKAEEARAALEDKLEQAEAAASSGQEAYAALQDRNKSLEEEIESLKAGIENSAILENTLAEQADKLEQMQLGFAALEQEAKALKAENERLKEDAETAATAQAEAEEAVLAAMQDKLEAAEAGGADLAALLAEEQERVKALTADIKAKEKEIAEMSDKMEHDGAAAEKLAALENALAEAQQDNQLLKKRLGEAQIELTELVDAKAQKEDRPPAVDLTERNNEENEAPEEQAAGVESAKPARMVSAVFRASPEIVDMRGDTAVSAKAPPETQEAAPADTAAVAMMAPPAPPPKPVRAEKPEPAAVVTAAKAQAQKNSLEILDMIEAAPKEEQAQALNAVETSGGERRHRNQKAVLPPEPLIQDNAEAEPESEPVSDIPPAQTVETQAIPSAPVAAHEAEQLEMELVRSLHGRQALKPAEEAEPAVQPLPEPEPVESGMDADIVVAAPAPALPEAEASRLETGAIQAEPLPAAASTAPSFKPAIYVGNILQQAGIPLEGAVREVKNGSAGDLLTYQWRTGGDLYGSAHQKPIGNESEFDRMVENYLSNTESRCGGDFAIEPTMTQQAGSVRIDSYEIACVGDGVDSSASLLFFNYGGTFTVLAHETPSQSMDKAMDYRDRLVRTIKNS